MPVDSPKPIPPAARSADAPAARRMVLLVALALVLATSAAYLTSFRGALIFDDIPGIADNPTIRRPGLDMLLIAIGPQGGTLSGRPVPNLTLALNYAISGDELWSYHAVNLVIHLLAGLALFGFARRTWELLAPAQRPPGATGLSWAGLVAALWLLHPLQTESVTYLVQRVESLMGLFYLLTLYCFVRSVRSPARFRWQVAAFVACVLGMGSKEVMVSAPLVVLLYDRTFVAGSFGAAWRERRGFHAMLFATWLVLGPLVIVTEGRAGTAGIGTAVTWWEYAFTQCGAIVHYLRLALWPRPLVFDYGTAVVRGFAPIAPQAALLAALLAGTVWALVRRPGLGFLGAAFFLILAPSSSVVPVATQTMTEHRMYLPLAPVIVLAVLGLYRALDRRTAPVLAAAAVALGCTTARRNLDYHDPMGLWADTARKLPDNGRAHNNTGALLLKAGRIEEARERFATALRLDPTHASAHYNQGNLLAKLGDNAGAIAAYETALRHDPTLADAHVNLGNVLDQVGRPAEAVPHYEAVLRQAPDVADARAYLGADLVRLGRAAEAVDQLQLALQLEPGRAETWNELAGARLKLGDPTAARAAAEHAVRLKPGLAAAWYTLGSVEIAERNFPGAIARYRQVLELAPDHLAARNNLANALLVTGQVDEAIAQYRLILRQRPDDAGVRENLARALELKQ